MKQKWFKQIIIATTMMLPIISINAHEPKIEKKWALSIDALNYAPSDQNWIFSPLSAGACLSMVYAGADQNTAQELKDALHLKATPDEIGPLYRELLKTLNHTPETDDDFRLNIVQGAWSQADFPFLEKYISTIQNDFQAKIDSVHFSSETVNEINGWAAENTENRIQNLLSPNDVSESTKLILANALYFKGSWINPFEKYATEKAPFTTSIEKTVDVDMMKQTVMAPYFENDEWQAILLPFTKRTYSSADPALLVLLPKNSASTASLDTDSLKKIFDSFDYRLVNIQIPKFTINDSFDIQGLLKSLGVHDAFTDQANFSKMDGYLDLYLSKVVQKCFFAMDEKGVEAAAATAAVMNCKCAAPEQNDPTSFIANHPFTFLLVDMNLHACLMIGQVVNPNN